MSRGKHFKHKEKGHPGNLPKTATVEGKDLTQYGKSVGNILPEETFKNRINEEKKRQTNILV